MTEQCFLTPVPQSEQTYLGVFRETMIGFASKPGPYFTARIKLMRNGIDIFKGIARVTDTMAVTADSLHTLYSVLEIVPTRKVDAVRSSALFSDLERNSYHNFRFYYFDSVDMVGVIYTRAMIDLYNPDTKFKSFQQPVTVRPTLSNASLLK